MQDRRVSITSIAETLYMSQERVGNILNNELQIRKVSARWVPNVRAPAQKKTSLNMSKDNLGLFEEDPDDFVSRFITACEAWLHFFEPETK